MDSDEEYSIRNLETYSYRVLQQKAKAMYLPSNVKKIYLIKLIHTKKFRSEAEVEFLVKQVRQERQQKIHKPQLKKVTIQQSTEISSTSNKSPSIAATPKRTSHYLVRYSPEYRPSRSSKTYQRSSAPARNNSDRVLRSYNVVKRPSYIINNNTVIGVIKTSTSQGRKETKVILNTEEKYHKLGVRTHVQRKVEHMKTAELVPVPRTLNISPPIAKRQRTVSGVYPLTPQKDIKIPNVIVRRPDGRLSKINAIIQKPVSQHYNYDVTTGVLTQPSYYDVSASMRESTSLNIPELTGLTDILQNSYEEIEHEESQYFHKKIRAEQIRSKSREVTEASRLPHITDVFSKFNTVYCTDLMQPIYVQVSSESEIGGNATYVPQQFRTDTSNTTMLEKLYNLKSVYLVNQPLLQICTTSNTKCVYSTPVITTALAYEQTHSAYCSLNCMFVPACSKPQPPISTAVNEYNIVSVPHNSQYDIEMATTPRVHDFFKNFTCTEDMSISSSSADTAQSQDLGANVTIPEMVEDALELISQDGDYMERMGMDIRMQCILCQWAGPKIILEYHIRQEHSGEVMKQERSEWCASYSLGALAREPLWRSRLAERDARLYVLSAKYEQPDCFMATLSTLSSEEDTPKIGRITAYNKMTGEPYTWEGEIQQLPPSLPYENTANCLKVELSRLNLLPNSANLKLINGELVLHSGYKVVVGQPALDDIYIVLAVRLLN